MNMTEVHHIPPDNNILQGSTPKTKLTTHFDTSSVPSLPPRPFIIPLPNPSLRPSAFKAQTIQPKKPSLQNKIGAKIDEELLGKSPSQVMLSQFLPEPQTTPRNVAGTYIANDQAIKLFDLDHTRLP